MARLGAVKAIYRYPVKSMAGERLAAAELRWTGIDGDRQYAFLRAGSTSRFPWLTGREVAELVTWSARYEEPANPRHSPVRVTTREATYAVGDPELRRHLCDKAGEEVRLIQVGRGTFDLMPVSVLSTATLEAVAAECGAPIDERRFRANIVIDNPGGTITRETEWLGGTLVFGSGPSDRDLGAPRLRLDVAIDRCVMITLDPETAARDPAILQHVVDAFGNEIGVRCTTGAVGTIRVGDPVHLLRAAG